MAILDEITPKYYQVHSLGMERQDGDVVAAYDIMIRNVLGNPMKIINLGSTLTAQEKQACHYVSLKQYTAQQVLTDY